MYCTYSRIYSFIGIENVPQSSDTADKNEYSSIAPDSRHDFSMLLIMRKKLLAENDLGQLEHHIGFCDMPPIEANNHYAWFS